jgi:hypothetical protein
MDQVKTTLVFNYKCSLQTQYQFVLYQSIPIRIEIKIMGRSEVTCLPTDCNVSELALLKSNPSTKRTSLSSNDIA